MEFHISPYLFQIGSFGLRYYSLMYLLALLAAYYWMTRVAKYDREKMIDYCVYGFVVVVLAGRFGYVLFYTPHWIWTDPLKIFKIWEGGRSFHGGFIGVLLWTWYYIRKQHWNFLQFTDQLSIPLLLGLGLGRFGNFMNGELWGVETDVPWCVRFPKTTGCRHPSQLYEMIAKIFSFGILAFISRFKPRTGVLSALFLILYGISRTSIEALWREAHWTYAGLSAGMWLSIPMLIAGLVLLASRKA